jgi:hypothetical protein
MRKHDFAPRLRPDFAPEVLWTTSPRPLFFLRKRGAKSDLAPHLAPSTVMNGV